MILYIARHGESLGNTGEDTGPDPKLSQKGKKQASLLGERMKNVKLDAVFSSPLIRAVETAEATIAIMSVFLSASKIILSSKRRLYQRREKPVNVVNDFPSLNENTIIYKIGR